MLALQSLIDVPWQKPRIVVLEISGAIGTQIRGPEMVRAIKLLREDARVQAVVVEIDSPGGSAAVSDMIYRSLQRLGKKKPVVAFTGTAALSGGYLIACAAQKIVSLPTALVGSIGVIFTRPVVEELMQKLGVRMVMTHEGRLKAMFQPWREPTPEETQKVQAMAEEYYDWFVNAVATSRNMSVPAVKEIATGEMFSANRGHEIGLVDELGDFERATDLAKELANVVETPRLQWIRPRRPLLERVLARGASSMAAAIFAEAETRISPRIDFR
jgi:protease-4